MDIKNFLEPEEFLPMKLQTAMRRMRYLILDNKII